MKITVGGIENFRKVAADLREMGSAGRGLSKEFYAGLERAAEPCKEAARRGASRLPQSGGRDVHRARRKRVGKVWVGGRPIDPNALGPFAVYDMVRSTKATPNQSLGDRVANATFSVKGKSGANPRITLIGRAKGGQRAALGDIDSGSLRHPVYAQGSRAQWHWTKAAQSVDAGWFTKGIEDNGGLDAVQKEMYNVIDTVLSKIANGG